ncbi:hypothetical protein LguiB_012590 [Lonicera macranthoides]
MPFHLKWYDDDYLMKYLEFHLSYSIGPGILMRLVIKNSVGNFMRKVKLSGL